MRRAAITVLIGLIWLLALAQPASAHTVSGVGATNWKTTLIGVEPSPPGLSVRVVDTGSDLEVSNTGPEVVVLGYQGEPYLRVGPGGVFENRQSPSTYLNCSRQGCPVPPGVDPAATPQWRQISSGHTARFHDHRIHWMGGQPPPEVSRAPGVVHQRPLWTVDLRQGATAIAVTGHLTWIPGPSPFPWLMLAVALAALAIAAALSTAWGPILSVLVGLLTLNDVYHAAAIGFSVAGSTGTRLGRVLTGSFYSIIGWVLGVVAVQIAVAAKSRRPLRRRLRRRVRRALHGHPGHHRAVPERRTIQRADVGRPGDRRRVPRPRRRPGRRLPCWPCDGSLERIPSRTRTRRAAYASGDGPGRQARQPLSGERRRLPRGRRGGRGR